MNEINQHYNEYKQWLNDLKLRICNSQIKASVHVNTAMIELYWSIGADIVEKQAEAMWGSSIIRKLSMDLRSEFPHLKGFSETNLRYNYKSVLPSIEEIEEGLKE